MSWTLDGRPLRRILVTRLRYLGDIAMSTVVLEVLRRGDPELAIEYLCDAPYAPLLEDHPDLTAVHALSAQRRGSDAVARRAASTVSGGGTRGTLGTILALRGRRFDLAVDLFFNPRSAWLLRLVGIPARICGTRSRTRSRLYTHVAPTTDGAVDPSLDAIASGVLAHHLGRLEPLRADDGRPFLEWLAGEYRPGELVPRVARPAQSATTTDLLAALGVQSGTFTLLAPAATWPTKAWPVECWRELIDGLVAAGHRPVILCPPGGPAEYGILAEGIPSGAGGILPPLALREALSVVAAARTLISVDGGIMHAGVAMSIPTVALFGPTDTGSWFPYEDLGPYRVLATRPHCYPCGLHHCDQFICLPQLDVTRVLDAVNDLAATGSRES